MKLIIPQEKYYELLSYAQAAYDLFNGEIQGWAEVEQHGGYFKLGNIYIPSQIISDVSTISVPDFNDIPFDKKIRCTWHSHHTMSSFHSMTDENDVKMLLTNFKVDYIISLVVNLSGKIDGRLYALFEKFGTNFVSSTNLDIDIEKFNYSKIVQIIKQKCKVEMIDNTTKKWYKL